MMEAGRAAKLAQAPFCGRADENHLNLREHQRHAHSGEHALQNRRVDRQGQSPHAQQAKGDLQQASGHRDQAHGNKAVVADDMVQHHSQGHHGPGHHHRGSRKPPAHEPAHSCGNQTTLRRGPCGQCGSHRKWDTEQKYHRSRKTIAPQRRKSRVCSTKLPSTKLQPLHRAPLQLVRAAM